MKSMWNNFRAISKLGVGHFCPHIHRRVNIVLMPYSIRKTDSNSNKYAYKIPVREHDKSGCKLQLVTGKFWDLTFILLGMRFEIY